MSASDVGTSAPPVHTPAPSDEALLRAHEPVLRFTAGELFLPTAVGPYVARCSLRADGPDGPDEVLVPAGALDLQELAAAGTRHRDRPLHLRFVDPPLTRTELRAWRREDRPRLRSASRFAAVGVLARLVDVLFRLSLLVRGSVPGGTVAAAERTARAHLDAGGCTYYGRVVRDAGYTVCQYWYFYAFNDWRSTFHGVNDHEADWETVAVYLVPERGRWRPAWVAASSHDHSGEALRRRWDDPGLRREGDHPVVFPGAGSHSGAFTPGDHVVAVELPPLRRLRDRLGRRSAAGFAIPFVDYARGDGPAVGPGHDRTWQPEVVGEDTPWVRDFRGLWGLDTRDALGGERAPAGPRYERDGAVRRSWADPLGWAGLATVPATPEEERALLCSRRDEVTARLQVLGARIAGEREEVRGLRAQARALAAYADTDRWARPRREELGRREAGLAATVAERTELAEERAALTEALSGPLRHEAPDAHLRRVHLPDVIDTHRHPAFLRGWAAVSTPLLVLGIGVLLTRPTAASLTGFATFLLVFAGVEAVARRRVRLLLTVLAVAALWVSAVASLVLAVLGAWRTVLAVALVLAAVVLLVVNLRELLVRRPRR
ncbi:hypothetical protein GCM10027451_49330 [Geodermatophilus aquaeductus]|uniref:Uncharacterized protein n=1 Tax=Geodermatophilus aquaeductus TaxID=1564161 RepID=A0A521FVE9_9ACTN|nr:hypothetical protein [Geodermatophilus aquaeductus]SMO99521.1 hypothetical protein SAMN06273567_11729 [Geodermatophilus aquaeductus]